MYFKISQIVLNNNNMKSNQSDNSGSRLSEYFTVTLVAQVFVLTEWVQMLSHNIDYNKDAIIFLGTFVEFGPILDTLHQI